MEKVDISVYLFENIIGQSYIGTRSEQYTSWKMIFTQPNGVGLSLGVEIMFIHLSVRPSVTASPSPPSCLNGGSYDQNEENRPCLTFWVDSKNDLKKKKKNLNKGSYDKI